MKFHRIEDVMNFLYSQLPAFHRVGPAAYKPGLDNTYALMKVVGNPHEHGKTIHIAGTNGKGSTSHLVASALQEAGYRTGLYTSPHLVNFGERIRINGQMIADEAIMDFVKTYHSEWESIQPSFFEITVALCFWYFKRENVDIAVIETALVADLIARISLNRRLRPSQVLAWITCSFSGIQLNPLRQKKQG